jgi:hypothetical protein
MSAIGGSVIRDDRMSISMRRTRENCTEADNQRQDNQRGARRRKNADHPAGMVGNCPVSDGRARAPEPMTPV